MAKHLKRDDNRCRGAFFGLAIGDALGAAVEFQPRGSFAPVTDYRGGGPHGLAPGEWTDDTSMALALAHSIGQAGWDLNHQAAEYVAWWRQGKHSVKGQCFDIGITTRQALAKFERTGDARTSGDRSERASGNGSIMRLAPVPIVFGQLLSDDLPKLAALAAESSLPTHASEQCLSACRYLALVLAGLMQGLERQQVLDRDWKPLQQLEGMHPLEPQIAAVASGSFATRTVLAIKGSGWVVQSLEAALWTFAQARDFREAVLLAVNLGDDADTTGAICGQLAGAYWGESQIPANWQSNLARRDMLEEALTQLM